MNGRNSRPPGRVLRVRLKAQNGEHMSLTTVVFGCGHCILPATTRARIRIILEIDLHMYCRSHLFEEINRQYIALYLEWVCYLMCTL